MLIDYIVKKNKFTYTTNVIVALYNSNLASKEFEPIPNVDIETNVTCVYTLYPKIVIVHYDKQNQSLTESLGVVINEHDHAILIPINKIFDLSRPLPLANITIDTIVSYMLLAKTDFATFSTDVKINGQSLEDILLNYTSSYVLGSLHGKLDTLNQLRSFPSIDFLLKIPNMFEFIGHINNKIAYGTDVELFIKKLLKIILETYITDFAYVNNIACGSHTKLEYLIRYNTQDVNTDLIKQNLLTELNMLTEWFCSVMNFGYCLMLIQKNYFGEVMVTIYKDDKPVFKQYIDMLTLMCFPTYYNWLMSPIT